MYVLIWSLFDISQIFSFSKLSLSVDDIFVENRQNYEFENKTLQNIVREKDERWKELERLHEAYLETPSSWTQYLNVEMCITVDIIW